MPFDLERWKANAELRRQVECGELSNTEIQKINSAIMQENRANGIYCLTGTIQSKLHRQKIGSRLKGFCHTEESRQHMSLGHLGKGRFPHTEETKSKMKARQQELAPHYRELSLKQWANPEMREKMIKAILAGSHTRPTVAEVRLGELIDTVCPDKYIYTGSGLKIVAGLVPDFSSKNGDMKVIEMFGSHWHAEEDVQERMKKFAAFGYSCLVIWEGELKNPEDVKNKIMEFDKI